MTNNRDLDEILAELGREHRAIDAPDSLEPVLRAAAGARKHAAGKPALRFGWAWAAVVLLLTAVATAGIMWQMRRIHQPQSRQVRSVPLPQVKPQPVLPSVPVTSAGNRSVEVRASYAKAKQDAPALVVILLRTVQPGILWTSL